MTRLSDLRGRLGLVTGAGSGIGEALAHHAATRIGMTIVVADRDAGRAAAVVARITADGGSASAVAMDVADWDSVAAAAAEVLTTHGAPALLACNAGIEHAGLTWETSPADWARVQGVNVNGAFYLMRAFVPAMIESGEPGQILVTSSVGGLKIATQQAAYAVSKHAVRVLAQSLQADLDTIEARLDVATLLPGPVSTRIFVDALAADSESSMSFRRSKADYLRDDGLTPGQLADIVFRAIDAGKRWIYPHPEMAAEYLARHTAELLATAD